MDFTQYSTTTSKWVKFYWISGTTLSVTTMTGAMIYIVCQWLVQSHLATTDTESAARGLQRTRRFRKLMSPFQSSSDLLVIGLGKILPLFRVTNGVPKGLDRSASLSWNKIVTCVKAYHNHSTLGTRPVETQAPTQRPRVSLQDPEGRQLIPESNDDDLYERSSRTPSTSRSSYELPRIPTPTLQTGLREYSLLPTQRAPFERRPSNEDLAAASESYEHK